MRGGLHSKAALSNDGTAADSPHSLAFMLNRTGARR